MPQTIKYRYETTSFVEQGRDFKLENKSAMRVKRIINIVIIMLINCLFFSCNKELPCELGQLQPMFIKYQTKDLDTFIIRKLKPNSNFSVIDSLIAINKHNISLIANGDTTKSYLLPDILTQDFDWQIFIPSTNQLFTISEIESEKKSQKASTFQTRVYCQNKIFTYKLNGVLVITKLTNEDHQIFPVYIYK